MKNKLKIISTAAALSAVGILSATSITLLNNGSLTKESSQIVNSSTQSDTTDDLIPAQANGQNANISTSSGPVTYFNNTITALDWYGNKLWEKDIGKKVLPNGTTGNDKGKYLGSWKRAWYNWDYNRKQNILWILGYAYNSEQKIFGLDAATGNIKYEMNLGHKTGTVGSPNQPYKFITALSSGKVLAYGDPVAGFNGEGTIYDPIAGTKNTFTGNSVKQVPTSEESKYANKYKWYFFNLIPIANNINIAEIVTFDAKQSGTKDDESAANASYNVYGILVDDKLDFIGNNQKSGSAFIKPFKIAAGIKNYRNTSITPQRDYYTLLNNKTVTVTYNNVSVIDASDTSNIKITQVKMTDSKWIQTWTVDANDNLYFKFLSDGKVYRISGDNLKSNQTSFAPSTYLDLGGVNNNDVKNNANNFLIYNVYGYTGQLMMINAKYYNYINNYDKENAEISKDDNATKLYGLAIAVVPNTADNNSGDLKGLLNTSNSFQRPADFTINNSALASKIPSEITKQDIELMNDAFFKDSDKKPFIISDIDDSAGTFKVTANLYKIPWFASTLPNDSTPKVITYTFDSNSSKTTKTIADKVSWKTLNSSTDYDFMNTLPSKITTDDVKALDPFQASFQSQTITSSDGTQLYPKTTYTTSDANDDNGTINVKVKYEYVPMSATYTDGKETSYDFGGKNFTEKQVLTFTQTKQYQVFKKSDNSAFWFTGASESSSDEKAILINITNVPQLKNLVSANTLPSSFDYLNSSSDSLNSAFLPFVNTTNSKGYPISKMKFKVTSDDNAGTLKIEATMPNSYATDSKDHTYIVTYTGLNTIGSYSFGFKDNVDTIDQTSINSLLPSSIDEGNILNNFITYKGYDSNDFDIKLTPNDSDGTLLVQVNLNKNYANSIGSKDHGFTNYVATKTFSGFMTTNEYNNRFSVEFVSDDDSSLSDLKGRQAQEIITAFGETSNLTNGLTVNGKTYTNLKDFVENVLVKSKGNSIPKDWKDNTNIKINVYVDNNLGMASFYIVIPKDQMTGATSDLNLVVTYSGFAKGNVDKTTDNFSFVSDKMLKNYLISKGKLTNEIWNSFTAETFADWLKTNIKDIVSYQTGEYVTKLSNNDFTVTTVANSVQNNVTVTINFGRMTIGESLSEYSIQYTL